MKKIPVLSLLVTVAFYGHAQPDLLQANFGFIVPFNYAAQVANLSTDLHEFIPLISKTLLHHPQLGLLSLCMFSLFFGILRSNYKKPKLQNEHQEQLAFHKNRSLEEKQKKLVIQNKAYKDALDQISLQNKAIELTKHDLMVKNSELNEALEEVKSQNDLLASERRHLNEAKRIYQEQNKKLLNIARDLDQQVQERMEELSALNELLQEKNKELDDFIYKSAHDLRGPIARLKGLSQLISMEYPNGYDISKHLNHLEQSANQMDIMLKRLSNVYEITTRPISRQKIDINDILKTVLLKLKTEEPYEFLNVKINNQIKEKLSIDPALLH